MGGSAETGGTGNLSNVNEYITIDTLADAADFGNLTYTSQGAAACADNTYGCHYGGYGNSFAEVNTIDRCTIQTLGNSVDHGDLTNTLGLYTQGASGNAA
jgi:acyl-homoserine lactone acylase PvdQ